MDLTKIKFNRIALREARGDKTLIEVAKSIGASKQQVHNYESGFAKPPADMLLRLILFFGKPVEFFTIEPGTKILDKKSKVA